MAGSQVTIFNGTDDDAVCRVSGGSGAPSSMGKDMWKWHLPKKKNVAFSVEIGNREMSLKLTEDAKGYRLEVVGVSNGNGRKPKPKPEPKPKPKPKPKPGKS